MYEIYQKLLDEKKLRNSDVARATGVSNMTLSDWKRGKTKPKTETMHKIASFLNVSVEYLMTGEEMTFTIEAADRDARLIGMSERTKAYALKLAELTEEDRETIFAMIDRFGK